MTLLDRCRQFSRIVDDENIHGLAFQHFSICNRRGWLHVHRSLLVKGNEHVAIGSQIDNSSYARDKSTNGLFGLSPDKIDWDACIVSEVKKSGSHIEAARHQLCFYLIMLSHATDRIWSGRIHVHGKKKFHEVHLDQDIMDLMERMLVRIRNLKYTSFIPDAERISACEGCSAADFCWEE